MHSRHVLLQIEPLTVKAPHTSFLTKEGTIETLESNYLDELQPLALPALSPLVFKYRRHEIGLYFPTVLYKKVTPPKPFLPRGSLF